MENLTIKQKDPQQFIIKVDGELDLSYLEALERAQKAEAIKYAGKQAIGLLGRSIVFTGAAVLTGLSRMVNDLS